MNPSTAVLLPTNQRLTVLLCPSSVDDQVLFARQEENARTFDCGSRGRECSEATTTVVQTRYGRRVACKRLVGRKYVVVVFEEDREDFIVVTALKVNKDRLRKYGFTRV